MTIHKTNDRAIQIAENLKNLGTKPNRLYTNKEIVDKLIEFQSALAKSVFEKRHAENLRDRDIMIHFESLAKEYDLDNTDTYLRFKSNMCELGYTIGTFIKGMNGERIARRALKLLSFEEDIKILYNIALEDEDSQAEYDAIVIAPCGIFVIEVKNWGIPMVITSDGFLKSDDGSVVYDIPGRMSIKEALLKTYIGNLFPEKYTGMLLFSNERANVRDQYKKIPIISGGGISYTIRDLNRSEPILTKSEIQKIAGVICSNHKEQLTMCLVNCDQIIQDYALLMAQIEEKSRDSQQLTENNEIVELDKTKKINKVNTDLKSCKPFNWRKAGKIVASITAGAIPSILVWNKYIKK